VSVYIDEDTRKKLQIMIQRIESETDLEAVAVINREGMRIACADSADIDVDEHSAAVAAMLNIAQDTSYRMDEGTLIQVVVRGEKGYTILTRLTPNLVLVASSKSQYKLGLYLTFLVKQGYKMAELLYKQRIEEPKEALVAQKPAVQREETAELFPKQPAQPTPPVQRPSIPTQPIAKPQQKEYTPPSPPAQPAPTVQPAPAVPEIPKKPKVSENEKKAILEALRIIGMIGKEEE